MEEEKLTISEFREGVVDLLKKLHKDQGAIVTNLELTVETDVLPSGEEISVRFSISKMEII